jgi:hypothetical protein
MLSSHQKERRPRVSGELGCVIEKRLLHHSDKILEPARFASLATQDDPFVLR